MERTLTHRALRAVDRAVADLRRGEIVAISWPGAPALMALAAEAADETRLAALAAEAAGPLSLVLTLRRAEVVGLGRSAYGVLALTLPATARLDEIQALADPTRARAVPPAAELERMSRRMASAEGAAIALAKAARLLPAVLAAPLPPGTAPAAWAAARDLLHVHGPDAIARQRLAAQDLDIVSTAEVPLEGAERCRLVAFRPADGGLEHLALVIGTPDPARPVLARIHSECFTGDLLGSLRCDCGLQLRGAIAELERQGGGVLLYLAQEGRGIGLPNKLRAYRLQDTGHDTVDANTLLGWEVDERVYLPAATMLRLLGFGAVRLMTNNPEKLEQLAEAGITVAERVPHRFPANRHNEFYLATKASRSGHLL